MAWINADRVTAHGLFVFFISPDTTRSLNMVNSFPLGSVLAVPVIEGQLARQMGDWKLRGISDLLESDF
jgi:hypothetical protein